MLSAADILHYRKFLLKVLNITCVIAEVIITYCGPKR